MSTIGEQVYLSRRNLLALLSKLDRVKAGGTSARTIIKTDDKHPKYPQSTPVIFVTALEDEEYYTDRRPGPMHPADEDRMDQEYRGVNEGRAERHSNNHSNGTLPQRCGD